MKIWWNDKKMVTLHSQKRETRKHSYYKVFFILLFYWRDSSVG